MITKIENGVEDLSVQVESLKQRLEKEIDHHRQAEERVQLLTEELEANKRQLAAMNEKVASYETNLGDRIYFDSLLSEISSQFINLRPERVDQEINVAQRRICQCLGLDICAVFQWAPKKPDEFFLTHVYRPLGGPPIPDPLPASQYWPWAFSRVMAGKTIILPSFKKAPEEASVDVKSWLYYNIKTALIFPLAAGDEPAFGAITFHDQLRDRELSDTIINRLQLVAQIIANAIARKNNDLAIKKSEQRQRLATDSADAGLWDLDVDSDEVWVSSQTRELFCLDADKNIKYSDFIKKIHQDDIAQVRLAIQESIRTGSSFEIGYRIILPDGNIRWIKSRGSRANDPDNPLNRVMGISLDITKSKLLEFQLEEQIQEIEKLKQRLENENLYLQKEIQLLSDHGEIVAQSFAMKRILGEAEQVAGTDSTVMITGETGTGKEVLARFIHQKSVSNKRPMVTINCASLPPALIESELFGREKGAYTGALTQMIGRFELADHSTLFLDEIGEMPIELQGKLLRVLEEGVFERLGSSKPIQVNVRVIAATNRNIEEEVGKGRFRRDLYYRLNVFPIHIPPLRERPEDIPVLVWYFVKEFKKRMGKHIDTIPKACMDKLQSYPWPGNVREMRNVIERAMILCRTSSLIVQLPDLKSNTKDNFQNLEEIERRHIVSVLEKTGWRVGGKGGAAEILNLKRQTLNSKIKKLGITRPHTER